jgi:homocitrate synthase NifV
MGLGERSGITAIEEAAAFLSVRRGRNYDIAVLAELARMVAKSAKIVISRNKAVAGRDIFSCESGLHVHGLYRDPALYEPYAPELVGAERIIAGGGKSGRSGLREHLSSLGIRVDAGSAPAVVRAVRREAENRGRPLSDEELRALARKTLAALRSNKGKAA